MATVNTPKDTLARCEKLDTGGRRLGTNALWNLAGSCLPILFTLGAMPFIIDRLGTDRFGVLLLVWSPKVSGIDMLYRRAEERRRS